MMKRLNTNLSRIEKKLGYAFKDNQLLEKALTHTSYAYETQQSSLSSNEVLEFLGDSVLGFVLADFLCANYPNLSEGDLTKLKSTAASTTALYGFAKNAKLDKSLFLGKGEEKSGGRRKKTILAGTFEAIVAAIYLDGGIEAAKDFLYQYFHSFFKNIDIKKFKINNFKSALQEHLQKENLPAPVYHTVTTTGPDHKKRFVVEVSTSEGKLAQAEGGSKKDAEQKAAQKALKNFLGKKIKTISSDTLLMKKKG